MHAMSRVPRRTIATGTPGAEAGWSALAVAAILILAALGAYGNSFNVPFLLDDQWTIINNASIRHLGQMGDVLSPPSTGTTAARPLLNLSFALNYAEGGVSVRGYHAVNLLIHVCAGLALLGIVRRTLLLPGLRHRYGGVALPLAAFAALPWTLHPLQTEAVTYISQRAESLMGLFYLLTLYCFIRSVPSITGSNFTEDNEGNEGSRAVHGSLFSSLPSVKTSGLEVVNSCVTGTGWLYLSVAACLCGMATKQVMVTAPVLVLLYDRAFVSGSFRAALANRRWYYVSLATTWLLLGFLMHRSPPAMTGVGLKAGVSWLSYALTELRVVTEYLKLAFWPHPLVFDYGTEILATDPLAVAPYALVIVAILVGVVIAWRRSPMAGFLGAWFFLILAPTSTVVPIADQPMAESRMYLPLAGVVVFVTVGGYALLSRKMLASREEFLATKRHKKPKVSAVTCVTPIGARESLAGVKTRFLRIFAANRIGHFQSLNSTGNWYYAVLGLVAVGLGALTIQRNHDYRSELSIWEDTLARHPHTSRGHSSLGMALASISGRLPDAIAHYEEALRINPTYADAHNNLANALAQIPGQSAEAIAHYEEALRLKPNLAEAHNNLAVALAQIPGRLPEAIAHYEEALRLKPDYAEAHNNLAVAYAETGRLEAAIGHAEIAARLNPASTAIRDNLEKLKARNRPDFGRPIP